MSDRFVDAPDALEALCQELRGSPWLTLDTEFIRERTYFPRLCLLQVANESMVACVDPLALERLDPLLALLYDPAVTKVLHSAQQDLEIFYHLRGAIPAPVFDTQVAATVLGHGEQVGYATLARDVLGVDLDKSMTRTDWSRRPLEPAQVAYAMDDVRHLRTLYHHLRAELESRGRLEWVEADFRELVDPERYAVRPRETWLRVKGHRSLRGVQLAVLRSLAAWREEQAIAVDRPRRWVLGDEVLLELARHMPRDARSLERIRGLEAGTLRRHGETLLSLIAAAREEPPGEWPQAPRRAELDAGQDALVDALTAVVRLCGARKGVSPQTLAGRRELERLVAGETDLPLLHGWRATVAGAEVLALLRGERVLAVREGRLQSVSGS